jgi:hypothetical protein
MNKILVLGASALHMVTIARCSACSADNSLYPPTIMLTDAKVLQTFGGQDGRNEESALTFALR